MANDIQISTAARNAAMDSVTNLINTGGPGTIEIYTGTKPAGPGTAVGAQVLLVTLDFSADAFADSVNGVATANAISSRAAVATGVPAWYRAKSGAGVAVWDGTVGTSGTDLVLGSSTINAGNTIPISSFTMTHPS